LPRLDQFTEGKFTQRFTSTDSTNRLKILLDELRIWSAYPLLGVGPGGSRFVGVSTAHTEFGRLPAEHGSLGILALLLLLVVVKNNISNARTVKARAITVCLIGWSFLFMMSAAMRLVAPAFAFGLTCASILPEAIPNMKTVSSRLRIRRRNRIVRAETAAAV
jgi:hypothetical protein